MAIKLLYLRQKFFMKNLKWLFFIGIAVMISIHAALKDKGKDPLHKKIYITNVTEIKNGTPSNKTTPDELEFKDGKLFSNFLHEKFDIGWTKYVIEKDTTFIDSVLESEVRYFEVKSSYKDDDNQLTNILCRISNENIEGEIKITKNDKPKKQFEFIGSEKATKIKENKKK